MHPGSRWSVDDDSPGGDLDSLLIELFLDLGTTVVIERRIGSGGNDDWHADVVDASCDLFELLRPVLGEITGIGLESIVFE